MFVVIKKYWRIQIAFALLLILLLSVNAYADNGHIEIESLQIKKYGEHYCADIKADIVLSETMQEALKKGVDLYFAFRFQVMEPRWYWLDKEVARGKERVELNYHALTRQYRLTQNNQTKNFSSLKTALHALGNQPGLLIKEFIPLDQNTEYSSVLQIWLDISRLSKPFQLEWLDTQDWNLSSEKTTQSITFSSVSQSSSVPCR